MQDARAGSSAHLKNFGFSLDSEHNPYVELRVTGLPPQKVNFPLTLSLKFSGATLVVRKKRIMSLNAGTCTASGTLCCEKVELFKRPLTPVRISSDIPFGAGIPIPFARAAPPS